METIWKILILSGVVSIVIFLQVLSCFAFGNNWMPLIILVPMFLAPLPMVLHAAAFAWDHAQPTEQSRLPFTHLLDAARLAGVCGDFFSGGDSKTIGVEAAALSGWALADALMSTLVAGGPGRSTPGHE